MAAVKYSLAKGKNQTSVVVGVDADYDAGTGVNVILDKSVITTKGEFLRLIRELEAKIIVSNWP